MKYPQLVSPRAVNAISDWLVSRLEQLGVESPQIYTRLLLSLLQSSVQVNDPIEFSNLEAFFANYKGSHSKRFHLPSDTETLKKLNAVQCLREIVSNEYETAAIELLVNELREKLKDIEQRSQDVNIAESFLIDTDLNSNFLSSAAPGIEEEHQQGALSHQPAHVYRSTHILTANNPGRILSSSENAVKDLDNDPKKRYFRAFPALTKEMEDSFRIWRRNAKSLTWPVVGRSIGAETSRTSHSNSANPILSSTNFDSNIKSDKVLEKKLKEHHSEEGQSVLDCVGGSNITVGELQAAETSTVSSKKKSKRRRNQALSKGKTAQNLRKITLGNSCSSNTALGGGGGKLCNQSQYRNTASPTWDTDFKGCWEMGPDLIKEFLARQKIATKRSRSNSDSMEPMERNVESSDGANEASTIEEFHPGKARPAMKRFLDISFCCNEEERRRYENEQAGVDYFDEDYDDDNTLNAAVPEIVSNAGNQRRLYQREGILQKPLVLCGVANDQTFEENSLADEQRDFAKFKAKFNSNVEALWKDVDPQADVTGGKANANGISSAFYATTSLNALAPFKHDLWNFWSNYNQHHYDPASTSSVITTGLDDSSASSGAGAGADIANSSDYFSMPSNLDDFDKSVGAVRRQNEAGASLGAHTPSINVFLQNSIWSSSGDCVDAAGLTAPAGETDESFLYKVWHSNKKLCQIDMGNKKDELIPSIYRDAEELVGYNKPKENSMGKVSRNGAKIEFPPYSSLKWSEGINAGPPYINLRQPNNAGDLGAENLHIGENKFASYGSAATVTGANWDAPVDGQNVQPDLKSWCASNPLSLTEMYGSDVCDSITQEPQKEADMELGPPVTLPNHSDTLSGFVAYARIKQCGLIQPQSKPLQQSSANASRLAKDYFRSGEDENLLTSESTHFHPIENFVDGHTFSISSALDVVEFERSASGYLYYESNEYMEYMRNDVYLADEEVATNSNLIGFAASASCQTNDSECLDAQEKCLKEMFVLKFRLKRSGEMACQTEDVDFQMAAAKMAQPSHLAERPEMPLFFNNNMSSDTQTNKEVIIAAVTKAVAAAAKVAAQRGFDTGSSSLPWVPVTAPQNQPWLEYPSLCDEVDSCIIKTDTEQLNQFWSKHAVEKHCHQRHLPTNDYGRALDIDKGDENSIDSSLHTLWGMCAVCDSCDYGKSMPANSLLRDELNLEADEIMSDLRFMQDLYIGETAESCTEMADLDRISDVSKLAGNKNDNLSDIKDLPAVGHVQASMLQKCNQLIEDLLKPEQTGKLMKMACENNTEEQVETPRGEDVTMTNAWSLSNSDTVEKANGHSWHYGNDTIANIWQHEPDNAIKNENHNEKSERNHAFIKPMKLLQQVGGSLNEEDNIYMDILDWEHDHLAKIWQQNDSNPPQGAIGLMPTENAHMEDAEIAFSAECQEIVEKKNLKNLQSITRTSPSSNALDAATFKRVQQFLNSSTAKMKIAANRKRRHSASQNFYHQQQQQLNLNNNNNNNDKITDMNSYKQKLANTAAVEEMQPPIQEPKQTFITCKYWTATTNGTQASLESAAAAMMLLAAATNSRTDGFIGAANYEDTNDEGVMLEENSFGNNFSCLIDKNASLFKHVAMMTRPLTR